MYLPSVKYTLRELREAEIADLIADAEQAERQAVEGPLYPERGITTESLLDYAGKCRVKALSLQED